MEEDDVSTRPRDYHHFAGMLTMTPVTIASSVSAMKTAELQARVFSPFKYWL
jgi:hypothetical protein